MHTMAVNHKHLLSDCNNHHPRVAQKADGSMDSMSDNSENSDNNGRTDDICRDFLRNVCKRGKRCKYRHPDPNEARELGKRTEYTFCHDFQNSGCRRPNCKFIHCTREEEEYYKQTGQLPVRLQQAAALGIGVLPNELPLLKGEVPICKDYLKGDCKRAGRCKYRHLTASEYEYEARRSVRRPAREPDIDRFNDTYNHNDYVDTYDRLDPAPKRRKLTTGFTDGFHENNFETFTSPPRTPVDYRLLEEENTLLRRKVEELRKQVSDLAATNEVLLEQNARYRANKVNSVTSLPSIASIATVSQMTPTISHAPAVARTVMASTPHPINSLNTTVTLPLTLNAASELIVSHAQQALAPRIAAEIAQAHHQAAATIAPTINQTGTVIPNTQSIVPVSLNNELIGTPGSMGACSMAPVSIPNLQSSVSLSHSSLSSIMSAPNTVMVSYPIMSHTQLPNSSLG